MTYGEPVPGMPPTPPQPVGPAPQQNVVPRQHPGPAADWRRRGLFVVVAIALLLVGIVIAVSFLPRWWSQTVGDMSNHKFRWGVWWGLFFGFVSTFVPLLVARLAVNRAMRWSTRLWILVVALLLAAPNLMTLGIVVGGGSAAHAGQRTLDTAAPGFRGATLVAAIVGVVATLGLEVFFARHRRQRRELSQLRVEEKLRRLDG